MCFFFLFSSSFTLFRFYMIRLCCPLFYYFISIFLSFYFSNFHLFFLQPFLFILFSYLFPYILISSVLLFFSFIFPFLFHINIYFKFKFSLFFSYHKLRNVGYSITPSLFLSTLGNAKFLVISTVELFMCRFKFSIH